MVVPSFCQWKHFYYTCSDWLSDSSGLLCIDTVQLQSDAYFKCFPWVTDNHVATVLLTSLQLFDGDPNTQFDVKSFCTNAVFHFLKKINISVNPCKTFANVHPGIFLLLLLLSVVRALPVWNVVVCAVLQHEPVWQSGSGPGYGASPILRLENHSDSIGGILRCLLICVPALNKEWAKGCGPTQHWGRRQERR